MCRYVEVVLAFMPKNVLRKLFPPIVTGPAIMLIGAGLTGTGMKYWGGGAVCAETAWWGGDSGATCKLHDVGPIKL